MSWEIPPESKDPAIWGSLTAVILMRLPLFRGVAYFIGGVACAKFLEPAVTSHIGTPAATATYLGACFGLAIIEKILSVIAAVDAKNAAAEALKKLGIGGTKK
jgi:hypothetical protein